MKLQLNGAIFSNFNDHLVDYPTPASISYFWGGGALAGICLGIQIITGVFLAMHYTPHVTYAFWSIEHIMRDVNNGWLIRYFHANGASIFFIVTYFHVGRGLYYSSYTKPIVWVIGVLIFVLMMATAFMGYVLPWGQMSFWGATVITNLFSAIPYLGKSLALWLWGGFSVDNATLNRFFALHYLLPFLIAGTVILHISVLHVDGSTNPLGLSGKLDLLGFYPFFVIKDVFGLCILLLLFFYLVCFDPNLLGHSDNYIVADSLSTPAHIVPEWYFLPFYAILRSIPDKLGGVVAMGLSIAILVMLPFIVKTTVKSPMFKPFFSFFYFTFILDVVILGWLGSQVVEDPFILSGQLATSYYFLFLLLIMPIIAQFENSCYANYNKNQW